MPHRHSGLKRLRWVVTLRGERLGVVVADNWKAACRRAVQRWKISAEDQKDLVIEKDRLPPSGAALS